MSTDTTTIPQRAPREGDRVQYRLRHIGDIGPREGVVTLVGRGGWDEAQVYVTGGGHSAWIDVASFDPDATDQTLLAHVIGPASEGGFP